MSYENKNFNVFFFIVLVLFLSQLNSFISGKIYQHVISKERKGDYLGKTVQGNNNNYVFY